MNQKQPLQMTVQQKISQLLEPYRCINERKNGVTIDYQFLNTLANPAKQITAQHILFFTNLLKKYFSQNEKIFVADCYFFVEFMPQLTIQFSTNAVQHIPPQLDASFNKNQQKPSYVASQPITLFDRYYPGKPQSQINQQQGPSQVDNLLNPQKINSEIRQENDQKPILLSETQQKQFKFEITNVTVTKAEAGKYKLQKMQQILDQYSLENNFPSDQNPIYLHSFAFFPINLKNDHWISALVNIKNSTIAIQDSAYRSSPDIVDGVKQILDYKKPKYPIQWNFQAKTPQQKNSQDCGIFVIYALFYIYANGKLMDEKSYDQNKIAIVRQNLVELTLLEVFKKELTTLEVQNIFLVK